MAELIIHDGNYKDFLQGGKHSDGRMSGCVPRNYSIHPFGKLTFAQPFDLPLIPESEWESSLQAKIASKGQLSDIRNISGPNNGPVPATDQNGAPFCWMHSGTSAMLMCRAIMGEPYIELSAFGPACLIKNYRQEGGWGSEGVEWIAKNGVPTSKTWPIQSMSRSNDTPEMRADASLHKFIQWRELDHGNMKAQLITCLLMDFPVVTDFSWWSHSVCTIDLVSINPFRTRILNSWANSWSENGTGILEGSKAIPDDALCAIVATPSQN